MTAQDTEFTITRLKDQRKVARMLATKAEREAARHRSFEAALTEAIVALGGEPGAGETPAETKTRDIDVTTRGREASA